MLGNNLQQTTSADDIFRCIFFLALKGLTYSMTFIAFEQAFLANEDLGDSLDSVEALFKKHIDFEKSLTAQVLGYTRGKDQGML